MDTCLCPPAVLKTVCLPHCWVCYSREFEAVQEFDSSRGQAVSEVASLQGALPDWEQLCGHFKHHPTGRFVCVPVCAPCEHYLAVRPVGRPWHQFQAKLQPLKACVCLLLLGLSYQLVPADSDSWPVREKMACLTVSLSPSPSKSFTLFFFFFTISVRFPSYCCCFLLVLPVSLISYTSSLRHLSFSVVSGWSLTVHALTLVCKVLDVLCFESNTKRATCC